MTWVACALVLINAVAAIVLLAMDPSGLDAAFDEARASNPEVFEVYSESALLTLVYVGMGGVVLWALGAVVVAVLAYRGQEWAWIVLLVSTVCAGLCFVVMVVGSLFALLPVIVTGFTFALLMRPEVRRWYADRRQVPPAGRHSA